MSKIISLSPSFRLSLSPCVLADFGFARYLQGNTMAATLCGSPMYMVSVPFSSFSTRPRSHGVHSSHSKKILAFSVRTPYQEQTFFCARLTVSKRILGKAVRGAKYCPAHDVRSKPLVQAARGSDQEPHSVDHFPTTAQQRWEVRKYKYCVTVLKSSFHVSVLYYLCFCQLFTFSIRGRAH